MVRVNDRDVEVRWTRRAEHALQHEQQSLVVELQLYFSCVVKKRVLFHQQTLVNTTVVSDRLELIFRPIASAVCDPKEFATSYPEGRDLSQGAAAHMVPRIVEIDHWLGDWEGQFLY